MQGAPAGLKQANLSINLTLFPSWSSLRVLCYNLQLCWYLDHAEAIGWFCDVFWVWVHGCLPSFSVAFGNAFSSMWKTLSQKAPVLFKARSRRRRVTRWREICRSFIISINMRFLLIQRTWETDSHRAECLIGWKVAFNKEITTYQHSRWA